MRASKGFKRGTRRRLARGKRAKFTVEKFIREFEIGQRVIIRHDPSSHRAMPHPRFKGMKGTIKERRGNAYLVGVRVGNSEKNVIAGPEHLKSI